MYKSPEWTDGDDVILLREVAKDRPFLARYGLVAGAWTSLAAKVVATEGFTRTNFSATKAQVRFTNLMSNHRSETETALLDSKCSEVCLEKRSLLDTLLPIWSSRKARADKKTPRTTDADSQRRKDTKGPTPASNCDVHPLRRDEAQAYGQKRGDDNEVQERDFELRQEERRQEDLRQDALRREELHHEKQRREELRQDALRREELRQEEQRREEGRREELRQEELHQEELRQEERRQEERRREEQEPDAERQSAAKRDEEPDALQRDVAIVAPQERTLDQALYASGDDESASEDLDEVVVQPRAKKRKTTRDAAKDDEQATMLELLRHEWREERALRREQFEAEMAERRDERRERMELARMEHERMMLLLQCHSKKVEARSDVHNV